MKKNEAQFQTKFGHWLEENWTETHLGECKYAKGGTFNVKQWVNTQPKQPRSLVAAKFKSLYYKMSDMSADRKPADYIFFHESNAYLIIYWEKHYKFTIISIENLLPYFEKSIKYDDAIRISKYHGALNDKLSD